MLDGYKGDVEEMLSKEYIGTRIFSELSKIGYQGLLSTVHRYIHEARREECAMSFGSLILFVTDVTCPSLTASSFICRILYMAVTLLLFCYFCYAGDTVRSASKDVSDIFYTLRACRKTQSVTTTTGQSNNHHVKTLLSFKNNSSPQPPPSRDQRGRLGGAMGYPSFKDEEGKGYDKSGVPLADPLLSSFRKRITGTFGVMGLYSWVVNGTEKGF